MKIPYGHHGHLCSYSGLAMQYHIHVYTGEIKVLLLNLGTKPFQISTGDAIAQLILKKISIPVPLREEIGVVVFPNLMLNKKMSKYCKYVLQMKNFCKYTVHISISPPKLKIISTF